MKMVLDFADVTITIEPKAVAAEPTQDVLSTLSGLVETLESGRTFMTQQAATINRLVEERDALAASLAAASAQS